MSDPIPIAKLHTVDTNEPIYINPTSIAAIVPGATATIGAGVMLETGTTLGANETPDQIVALLGKAVRVLAAGEGART